MISSSTHPAPGLAVTAWTHSRTGVAVLDAGLRLRSVNPALVERLGGGRRLLDEPLAVLDGAPPTLAETASRALAEQRTILLRSAALRGNQGEFACDLAFVPLASDEVLLELYPAGLPVEPVAPHLSESLRGFAHEVKNPLAGVRGAAQLLRRRLDTPELAELAELILAEVDRLTALADRLLQSSGKPRLARIGIHALTERVAALIAAQSSGVSQTRDYDPSLPMLNGDADRLTQVLLNLARNAVEAGARGLIWRTRAEHAARLGGRGVRLAVRVDIVDDGHGVPADLVETLFQPLVSGRVDGSGLGLALAQEIAREHGGELRYSSRPGATVFSLLLPAGDTHG